MDETPQKINVAKKILWIEDDFMIGTILGAKLIGAGYELMHINTGEEAMYYLKDMVPDLIVLDLLLPGIDGFAVLKHIHTHELLNKVPVIILSNVNRQTDIESAKKLGARTYLVKTSTTMEQVLSEVSSLLK